MLCPDCGTDSVTSTGMCTKCTTTLATPANLVTRLGARIVDGLILAVVLASLWLPAYLFLRQGWVSAITAGALCGFFLAVDLYNQVHRLGTSGRSWGKQAVGIAVVDTTTGLPIGRGRAALRHLVGVFLPLALTCLLDGSDFKRGWPDRAARSTVISTKGIAQ